MSSDSSSIDFGPLIAPPPGMNPCSPAMRALLVKSYSDYYETSRKRIRNVRAASLIIFGLIAISVTYTTFHRFAPSLNPMPAMAGPNVPHKGIRPKQFINPPRDPVPAYQKPYYLLPPRMRQKMQNYIELIRAPQLRSGGFVQSS